MSYFFNKRNSKNLCEGVLWDSHCSKKLPGCTRQRGEEELGSVGDFTTKQPHFRSMCQEGADKEYSKLFGPSNGECVNVGRPGGSPQAMGVSFTQYSRTAFLGGTLVRILGGKG